jgi:DNA replication protein DnaC
MSDIFDELGRLGLRASRSQLDALLTHATKNRFSPVQVVEHLVDIERRERDARNLASREKKASVGPHKTMDRFDWDHPTKIDRLLCEEQVLNLAFLKTRSNVLFRGPAGLGKTMLEQNTATAALAAGMTVCFTNVGAALADLLRQESLPAVERRIKRYTSVDLLAFDELGYVPCDARAADLLFQIISRRHEKASTIIATNLAFKEWGPMFHGAASLVPLIDRFTQHLVTVDIEGESYRQKEKDMPPTSPRSSSSARVARKAGTPRRPKRRRST